MEHPTFTLMPELLSELGCNVKTMHTTWPIRFKHLMMLWCNRVSFIALPLWLGVCRLMAKKSISSILNEIDNLKRSESCPNQCLLPYCLNTNCKWLLRVSALAELLRPSLTCVQVSHPHPLSYKSYRLNAMCSETSAGLASLYTLKCSTVSVLLM